MDTSLRGWESRMDGMDMSDGRQADREPRADGQPCCGDGRERPTDLRGKLIDPGLCMRIISHPLRRRLLAGLYQAAAEGPLTKMGLAQISGLGYDPVNYQLNRHLREFWVVTGQKKMRGAYLEYIAPKFPNTIFINPGTGGVLFIIDPVASLFGPLKKTGSRCDMCGRDTGQREGCLKNALRQPCFALASKEQKRMETMLRHNGRKPPYTPVDHLMYCAVVNGLEKKDCVFVLGGCGCDPRPTRA
jgi:hypothetical protein